MKTPEDEAFEDIERRQGGGFPAKRAMAADKLQEPAQDSVVNLWECIGRWSAYLVANGKQADYATPSWLVEAVQNATTPPKREWVDLTNADADDLFVETQRHMIGHGSREFTRIFTRLINAKLKEQNT